MITKVLVTILEAVRGHDDRAHKVDDRIRNPAIRLVSVPLELPAPAAT